MEFSIVVPVYNGAGTLEELFQRCKKVFDELQTTFEMIFVEDCGQDNSWEVIRDLALEYPQQVVAIKLARNFGQHNALLCGIRSARGKITITMDDDLQHPPEELPKLLAKLVEGYDVVYGTPAQEPHNLLRGWASRITKLALQSAIGAETARKVSALRVFRQELRDAFTSYHSPFVNIDVLLTWATNRFAAVSVRHELRQYGESGYTVRKLINHALNMMTGFSTLPLQVASIMGFIFSFFGFLVLAYVLGHYFVGRGSIPGFPFLASIIAIFSGAQLFALGILGEYLARIHFRTMERPPYLVRERTDAKEVT
jgi:undecaprenyl-phosphate 4-deoxy-4-formamido-L-arabinose transferase